MTSTFRFATQLDAPLADRPGPTRCGRSKRSGTRRSSCPTTSTRASDPIAAMASAAAVTHDASRSERWSSTATSAIPRCWPASSRRSTCCPRAASRSASAPGGSASTTTGRASRWIRPGVRVSRMIEHAAILRGLLRGETVTAHGEHYRITDLPGTPRSFTDAGGPPFLIGGGAPAVAPLRGQLRRHRRRERVDPLGRDRPGGRPGRHAGPHRREVRLGPRGRGRPLRRHRVQRLARRGRDHRRPRRASVRCLAALFGVDPETGLASPLALVGTEDQVIEHAPRTPASAGATRTTSSRATRPGTSPRVVARLTGT